VSALARRGGAAAALLVAVLGAARARSGTGALVGPPPPPADAGPIAQSIPAGAVVAEDEAALRDLLARPGGPAEIWLRARTYRGDFEIRRPLSLRGELGAALEGTGRGTVLSVEADDVSVDNLAVRHSGRRSTSEDAGVRVKGARARISNLRVEDTLFGVTFGPCPACLLEHTRVDGLDGEHELRGDGIKLWESNDAVVRRCVVDRVRDVVVWYSRRVALEDNTVTRSRYGTHFMYAHDAHVRRSRIVDDVVGIFVMYSDRIVVEDNVLAGSRGSAGVGLGFKESDGVSVRRNWLVANTTGTYLDRTPREADRPVTFEGNVIALNDVGLRLHGAEEGAHFLANDFHQNVVVAEVDGGGDALKTELTGNHWSDYAGYDLDDDGVGDVPFEIKRLSGELTDEHPELRLFEGTGAMGLVDAIAHAVPVLASRRLLVDPKPAIVPHARHR
jgi:nitrous oxidase accessory protein